MKCKLCKIKIEKEDIVITHGISRFCSKACRQSHTREKARKEKDLDKQKKKNARESVSMLTKKLDGIFSKYIRRKYSDKDGIITCISCEKKIPWKESQNCHWISRGNKQYRYDEDNCRPGCISCNKYHPEFHLRIFTIKQIKRLGQEVIDIMIDNTHYLYKQGKTELRDLINKYTIKLKKLGIQSGKNNNFKSK